MTRRLGTFRKRAQALLHTLKRTWFYVQRKHYVHKRLGNFLYAQPTFHLLCFLKRNFIHFRTS